MGLLCTSMLFEGCLDWNLLRDLWRGLQYHTCTVDLVFPFCLLSLPDYDFAVGNSTAAIFVVDASIFVPDNASRALTITKGEQVYSY